jgi:hypothetical protein
MKIEDILAQELVLPDLAARSKTDVLVELANAVSAVHPELERERLVQALEDRERLNSTALGDGVAIPHGKLPGIKRVFAAFARSRQGVGILSLDTRTFERVSSNPSACEINWILMPGVAPRSSTAAVGKPPSQMNASILRSFIAPADSAAPRRS